MELSKGAGAAAYNEKSETDILGENDSWQIPIDHNDFKILKNNESQLCEVLWNKFGCVSTLVSPAQESNSESQQVFRKRLTPGLELSVWKGDLTRHAVDVVVNAANEELRHGGGLAQALVKAGGQQIQEESDLYISRYGKIPTGGIAITGPGKLPCKCIIHAVGPRWVAWDRGRCQVDLRRAIENILDFVTAGNLYPETVAIPALSSGIFQFPLDLCTRIIVKTIRHYFQGKQLASNLKEIHLVSNEDPTVAAFKTASENILGTNELGSSVSQGAILPSNTMVVNSMTLQIVQGHIELQQTDVIVNSVSPPFRFGDGPVSKSILQRAGHEIEEEFHKNKKQKSQDSQLVVSTKGFKLSCPCVFHVLWLSTYSDRDLILKHAVNECLQKCLKLNLTSISFPALGAGGIGIEDNKVAQIMCEEVLKFAQHCPGKQLTIKFVILSKDQHIYKAFSTAMEKIKSRLPNNYSVPQEVRGNRENELKAKSPAIRLMGSNQEKMSEAEEWIQRILTHQWPAGVAPSRPAPPNLLQLPRPSRAPPPPPSPPRPGPASRKMHYYRYSNAEVSCWYKYLLFSYNIVFWLAGVAFLGAGLWAWSEKGVLSDLTKVTRLHGIDPVVLVLMVGVVMFTLGFAGCVGALRENICLLKFFCGTIVLIFFLELAVAVLAFLFQDWVRDRFREFFESNIKSYRDDIDLQNLIDSLQKANQCCGAYGPEDWDLNVYFNCSGASYSREKCGVPFSCCVPDPAQKVLNTQCGYDVRTQLKSKWDEFIFTKGCIPALEGWLPRNIYIVAGVFIAISLLQIFGIFLAKTLISDIEAVKAGHHF